MNTPDIVALEPPAEASLVAVGYGPDRHEKLQIVLLADNGTRLGSLTRAAGFKSGVITMPGRRIS